MKDFAGKIAVVTGGGSGMGRELVLQLAAEGCNVALCDLSEPEMRETRELAKGNSPDVRVTTHVCDVSDEAACNAMVAATVAEFGGLDVVVCNAGIPGIGSVADTPLEQWERVLRVNATGTFLTCRAALPQLALRGG